MNAARRERQKLVRLLRDHGRQLTADEASDVGELIAAYEVVSLLGETVAALADRIGLDSAPLRQFLRTMSLTDLPAALGVTTQVAQVSARGKLKP